MPSEATSPSIAPLIGALEEEARKAGVSFPRNDPAFIRKLENLSKAVAREFDVILSFRAFLADPGRNCTVFWFPDKYDKYHRRAAQAQTAPKAAERESLFVECPVCRSLYQKTGSCPYCAEHPEGPPAIPVVLPWKRSAHDCHQSTAEARA